MRDFLPIVKALAEENRLRVLCALRGRELCVCQIIELLGLAPSTVSKHMSILHQARLVDSRKDGRWIYYTLPREAAPPAAREAVAWVCRSLERSPEIGQDAGRLAEILKMYPEELCRKQSQCAPGRRGKTKDA